jgi:hypothetical protein
MRAVWKFKLERPNEDGFCFISVPPGSEPVSVGLQDSEIVVWCMVDPHNNIRDEEITLFVTNTGSHFDEKPLGRFLGTVTSLSGIVWHIYKAYE